MNWKNCLNVSCEPGRPPVLFIVGPTASGKTARAIEAAEALGGEIVSADAMQIYRHMDIATAKPTHAERARAVHHLIDCVEPDQPYSVAEYKRDAQAAIAGIFARGRQPIVCGGTGLYVNALSLPFDFESPNTDPAVRARLETAAKTPEGRAALYERLRAADPEAAAKIHPNNVKRVVRALEIYAVSGRTKTAQDRAGRARALPYTPVLVAPVLPREVLYDRIDRRVERMLEDGIVEEARRLEGRYGRDLPAMQAIGYKEFYSYFDGETTLEEAVRILKRDTRHFAKRQLTWFRRDARIVPLPG